MKVNKNIIIAILLLSVFAVGTISILDTVEAAKWKKFDSGTFTADGKQFKLDSTFNSKKKVEFISYSKGSNQIKIKFYAYKKKNNKKVLESTTTLTKSGKKLKVTTVDYKGKKHSQSTTSKNDFNLKKTSYTVYMSFFKNTKSTYLNSLKSTGTSKSGSTGNTGSTGTGRYEYEAGGYEYVYEMNYATGNYDYVYKFVPGKYVWKYY